MIDIDRIPPIPRVGSTQEGPQRPMRLLAVTCVAGMFAWAIGGAAPAFAQNGETTATLYSTPNGFEFTIPCDMDLQVAPPGAPDEPAAKGACHLWDEAAPDTELTEDRDLGLAADVNIINPGLVLPGQVDEEDETVSKTTSAQAACGEANGEPFCIVSAWTAGTARVKGNKVSVTRGGVGRLLIRNDGCENNCDSGGGPFTVSTDANAIADENDAVRLVYPEAGWVEWMLSMNSSNIGDSGAYAITLDDGLRANLVPNGAIITGATLGANEEIFSAVKTPGVYCTVNGVCVRF